MKKNIFYFCLVILLVLPICINADTFEESANKVSSYLDRNEYKNSYNKYLYITESNRFSGMISKKEFDITRYDKDMNYRSMNYSYLWNGKSYWSETVESGKNIPIRNDYLPLSSGEETDNIGTRVTQIISNKTSVYGSGTYSDPWLFSPQYNVRIRVNDKTKGHITNEEYSSSVHDEEISFVYVVGSGIKYIYIKSLGANQYIGSTCGYIINGINANNKYTQEENGNVVAKGGYLIISNITRDTECMINFGEKPKKVILDQTNNTVNSSPKELYLASETGWYLDEFGNNQIMAISANPERLGYIYEGYTNSSGVNNACSGTTIIKKDKTLVLDNDIINDIQNNQRLYACYTPISYKIEYICQNGTGATTTSDHVYDVEKELRANSCQRVGYTFKNWSTASNGSGSTYDDKQAVKGIYSVHNGTLKLYSQWNPRSDITYVVKHWQQTATGGSEHNSSNFTVKENKTFNNGVADTINTFYPTTYTGFTSPSSQNVRINPDGSTVINFYYTRNTYTVEYSCNNGSGSTAPSTHKYDVEKALTTNGCYRNGYSFDGWATTQTGSVAYTNGKTVKNLSTANGATVTLYAHWSKCSAGSYSSDGKTCTSCPSGYTSDVGSDSISDCYLTTVAGKYVSTANQDQTTCAANGYCPGGTVVKYGNTGGRSNCPSNYTKSNSGSDAETDCYLTTSAGKYVATKKANQEDCAANGYCPGSVKVYYNSTGGRENCPSNYGSSNSSSNSISSCYLTTTAGKYVKTANTAQTDCISGYYCSGGTTVYYGETGGITGCPSGYGSSDAGSSVISKCYLTTSSGKYVANANTTQTNCTAGNYCPGGTKIYYGNIGGINSCPTNYGSSAASSNEESDCYLTTTAGKYVSTAKAAQVNCEANYYCSGGTTVYYGKTGGRASCSTGYHSSAGASSCSANTYTVTYNKNSSSASGSMTASSHTYGTAKNLTANGFSRSGYTFNGWNTKSDGSGTSYSNKASVINLTSTHQGNVTLYAKWKLAVSCDNAAITYYNQNQQRSPIPCNIYNGVYDCVANTSSGKCDCTINAFYSGSSYYCCTFDDTWISASYNSSAGKYQCKKSFSPVSKGSTCQVVNNSYNWCSKYW